jgi:hypothetical protein
MHFAPPADSVQASPSQAQLDTNTSSSSPPPLSVLKTLRTLLRHSHRLLGACPRTQALLIAGCEILIPSMKQMQVAPLCVPS